MLEKNFRGTVLLVTNDECLRKKLQHALLQDSYGIRVVRSQEEGLKAVEAINPAILVVDRRESGFSRLRHEVSIHPPIVTVMYHGESCHEQHCVMDIEDGADRAVCNASPSMIVALLGAVLRRQRWEQTVPDRYAMEGMTVDCEQYTVTVDKMPVHTSPTEFRILKSLVTTPGHYVSRTTLHNQVWGEGFAISSHALEVHISSLRRKLHQNGLPPRFIQTVKGLGYKLRSTNSPVESPLIESNYSVNRVRRQPCVLKYQARSLTMNG